MQIAISTESLSHNTVTALEKAADLGFTHVELNLQTDEFGYGYRRRTNARFYRQLSRELKRFGLSVWSATSPPLTQAQMFFERARKDILLSGAIAAGLVDAQVYVVRPADVFTSEIEFESYLKDELSPPVVEGFDEAWVQTVNRRMTMALRNQSHWIGALLTNESGRMNIITEHLAVGWAMDVPAALSRGDMASWLKAVGERIAVAHLYDFVEEEKRAPLQEAWQEWLPALAQTRLKCAVIHAPDSATDDDLVRSRNYLEGIRDQ